jgi:putative peptidoglycan lipid II flippase
MQELVQRTEGTLAVILFFVVIVGIIAAPLWVRMFAPGFVHEPEKLLMAQQMLQITFPYLLCVSLAALSAGVLNTFGQFSIPAFTPTLLNIVMVMAAYYLAPYFHYPEMGAAWGVFIAGFVQMLFQFPFLYRIKMLHWPKWGWRYLAPRFIRSAC